MRPALLHPLVWLSMLTATASWAQATSAEAAPEVQPIGIGCESCAYPYPVRLLPLHAYGQDLRLAYMDVAPQGPANGHVALLLHGNNFGGYYFGPVIDALAKEGFRVVVPDQIGYGRSSKPTLPYSFSDMAANTRRLLEALGIAKVMVVGHSMGGMAAARFATQNADLTERVVLYDPIGLVDARFGRRAPDVDAAYRQTLEHTTWASTKALLMRYVAHDPSHWNAQFEAYARQRYAMTLGAEWPRLAMSWTLTNQMIYADPVVDDWAHIQVPTLVFGGADDQLPGSAAIFQARMKFVAETIPNHQGRLLLLPGLGHVPHMEAPDRAIPPLVAFLKEGVAAR